MFPDSSLPRRRPKLTPHSTSPHRPSPLAISPPCACRVYDPCADAAEPDDDLNGGPVGGPALSDIKSVEGARRGRKGRPTGLSQATHCRTEAEPQRAVVMEPHSYSATSHPSPSPPPLPCALAAMSRRASTSSTRCFTRREPPCRLSRPMASPRPLHRGAPDEREYARLDWRCRTATH